jgi:hypothetical protein
MKPGLRKSRRKPPRPFSYSKEKSLKLKNNPKLVISCGEEEKYVSYRV